MIRFFTRVAFGALRGGAKEAKAKALCMTTVLKIFNHDGTYQTCSLHGGVTCSDLVQALARRQNLTTGEAKHFALYLAVGERARRLSPDERPLQLQVACSKITSAQFVFADSRREALFDTAAEGSDSSGSEDERAAAEVVSGTVGRGSRRGYLLKRGTKNPNAWRRRWFVLKGDRLWFCKSHTDMSRMAYISLPHNSVTEVPATSGLRYCFEVQTAHRVYQLRAKTLDEMQGWTQALRRHIALSSENDLIRLAEMLIADEEFSRSRS